MQTKKKRSKKTLIILIILAELSFSVAACCAIFYTSSMRIAQRRQEAVFACVNDFDRAELSEDLDGYVQDAMEQIWEERDETVWTTADVNYREGAGDTYESAGTLGSFSSVTRTGVTFNDWSRVSIGDNEYYISSEYLTTEEPIIKVGGQKGEYQKYALSLMSSYGWKDSEMYSLIKLWDRESGWNPNSHNGSSGAHGIPQALPASKMASEGSDYYTNGNTQIRWGLNYIARRYGSPSNAWAHFCSSGWY